MPDKGRILSIQTLRGLAAMMVVFHHAQALLPHPVHTEFGQFGVDIFFVISGFIIYLTGSAERATALDFAIKRFIRVVPLYWIFTLILAAAVVTLPSMFRSTQVSTGTLAASLLFIPHHNLAFPDKVWPVLIPGWSLNFEVFFYVLTAIALLVARPRLRAFLATVIALCVIAGFLLKPQNAALQTYTHPLLLEFLGGVLLGAAFRQGYFARLGLVSWLMPAAFALLLVHPSMYDPSFGYPPILPAVAIVAGALALEGLGRFPRMPILHRLGDASYSIYLSHVFILGALRPVAVKLVPLVSTPTGGALFLCLALITAAAAGAALYVWIERPLLIHLDFLRRKHLKPMPRIEVSAGPAKWPLAMEVASKPSNSPLLNIGACND